MTRNLPVRVTLGEDQGRRALLVEGVVQSVAADDVSQAMDCWQAQIPDACPQRVLILGLGGGTVAQLITRRFGPVPIVGVDHDPDVIELAMMHLGLNLPNLSIVKADALSYLARCTERFDLVCVDLYCGGQIDRRTLGKPFMRDLLRATSSGGTVVFNLFRERRTAQRISRIERYFRVSRSVEVGRNLVLHCRAR